MKNICKWKIELNNINNTILYKIANKYIYIYIIFFGKYKLYYIQIDLKLFSC